MLKIKLADIVIQINNHYDYLVNQCKHYISDEAPEIIISITDEEIKSEQAGNLEYALPYCESLAVYRKICQELIFYDTFLLHGAFFSYNQKGLLFTGPSGSGKTTQLMRWKNKYKNDVIIINGDKPLFRYKNGKFWGYGTPWAGKENLSTNTSQELKAIMLIKQAKQNSLTPLPKTQALNLLMTQAYFPNFGKGNAILLKHLQQLLSTIPIHVLHCNLEADTIKTGLNVMQQLKKESDYEN